MMKILTIILMLFCAQQFVVGQTMEEDIAEVKSTVLTLQVNQEMLQNRTTKHQKEILSLVSQSKTVFQQIDSLSATILELRDSLYRSNEKFRYEISQTNNNISESEAQLTNTIKTKSIIGLVVFVCITLIGVVVSYLWIKKADRIGGTIEMVKNAQIRLQLAQKKLEEESMILDNKLVELIDKQMSSASTLASVLPDHTLALKVADEVTRIELNLSKMDSTIKGYKQLSKGIERIKNNFLAKGYEIADMLGKPYNEGMRLNADFVIDESLEIGTRTITSITKPQVTYNGEIIQKAIVTVTQNF